MKKILYIQLLLFLTSFEKNYPQNFCKDFYNYCCCKEKDNEGEENLKKLAEETAQKDIASQNVIYENISEKTNEEGEKYQFARKIPKTENLLVNTQNFNHGVCGGKNLGNTCYMNSAIACLSNCPELTSYFLSEDYKKEINEINDRGTGGQLANAWHNLLLEYWLSYKNYGDPSKLKEVMGKFAKRFSDNSQQDSCEFITYFLNFISEDLNKCKNRKYKRMKEQCKNESDIHCAQRYWNYFIKNHDSIISDIFTGIFKSSILCKNCEKYTIKYETFNIAQLAIPKVPIPKVPILQEGANQSDNISIIDCIKLFKGNEEIKDTWYCKFCKKPIKEIEKKMEFFYLPKIFIVCLKRFINEKKNNELIDIDIDNLDMSDLVCGPEKENSIYECFAISQHKGESANGGHYTAICKNIDGNWYEYNDRSCTQVHIKEVESSSEAFVIFFRRKDNPLK